MRALYEIELDMEACVDPETGEVDIDRLNELNEELDTKIEKVALYIRQLEAENVAYESEKKRFEDKIAANKKKIDGYKRWLPIATNGQKFHGKLVDVTFRKSTECVVESMGYIPPDYIKVKIDKKPDRAKLKKDILAGVIEKPEGVEIVEKLNTQVK